MFNLHHLKIFLAVAQEESYSRAADRLEISQPAVSMQVGKLEESLGVKLVAQKGRQVALTEAGQVLSEYAGRLFRISREMEAAMADFRDLRRGRLRIGASSTPGAYVLPGVIASFRAERAGVEISLQVTNTRHAIKLVADGLADVAVVGEGPAGEAADVELSPLCRDCLSVVVSPGHPWALAGVISPEELARVPLIMREAGSSTREVFDRRLAQLGLKVPVALELGSTDAVREAAAEGLGPAVLSGWAVRRDVTAGRLVKVGVKGLDLARTLFLAVPRSAGPEQKHGHLGQQFVAHLRKADLEGGCL